ncbi:tRNA (5-methylaminomethyl-2-thiouridine)(34)-methyltransferase MnmD [Gilliamella sp. wkB112]|uniref:tRNA (5-methylaminomethyl-2-thiouridine)(34)-methyltransferase MnmD n=1 Tax=Gilliamella sp. wkB112 TaxID=3120257 RepID=UPI00080E41F8|nr:tRNA (5-methylaminomethyl-2-thiouridine)(34)-methyltransferase MnmD [Gilliamella apicola]OCG03038.1 hypothetical protein A9G12_08955 [Gilliamella apicola]
MPKATIFWDENQNPMSSYFNDVYFNTDGAIAETNYVFIEGNNLYQRFLQHCRDEFIVGETGFGSGLSFLLLWHTFLQFRQQHPEHILKQLKFFSVEKYPLSKSDMVKIHDSIIPNNQPLSSLAKQLQTKLDQGSWQQTEVSLAIFNGDVSYFPDFLVQQQLLVDAWFFDGFSPAKNPDMWSESLFNACFQLTASHGSFATFTAAGFVRRNLINAGFVVSKRQGFGVKREMLIGYKK